MPPNADLRLHERASSRRPRRAAIPLFLAANRLSAALVSRLHKPGMTDDQIDELVRIVEAYLSGRLCAADWRRWLRRREDAERATAPSLPRWHLRQWTS
jgi:hypothetical protein